MQDENQFSAGSSSAAKDDLEAVSKVLSLWAFLCSREKGETYLSNVLGICRELYRLASKKWQDNTQAHHQFDTRIPIDSNDEQGGCQIYNQGTIPWEQSQMFTQAESQPSGLSVDRLDPSGWIQSEPLLERAGQTQWSLDFLDMSNPFSSFYSNLI